jgi:uroporphyrinogen-III synthase
MKRRWRVLVLRPEGQWEEFSRLLDARGFDPIVVPGIRILAPSDPAALDEAVAHRRLFDWIVFASANGVSAFVDGLGPRELGAARVAAVGPVTRRALERNQIKVDWIPTEFTTSALARQFPVAPPARILLVRAENAGTGLEESLGDRGYEVERADAYRTEPTGEAAIRRALEFGVHAIALTSASIVASFVSAAGRSANGAAVCCIGPATEAACRRVGLPVDTVAPVHTAEGLVEAIFSYFQARSRNRSKKGKMP